MNRDDGIGQVVELRDFFAGLLQHAMASDPVGLAADGRLSPETRKCGKVFRLRGRNPHRLRTPENGPRQRVRTMGFKGGGIAQHFLLGVRVQGNDPLHGGLAVGEGARLIQRQRFDPGRSLQVGASLDKHSVSRRRGDAGNNRHRSRDGQGAWTGDDQNDERLVKPSSPPAPEGHRRDRLLSSFCGTAQVIFNQSLRLLSWGSHHRTVRRKG